MWCILKSSITKGIVDIFGSVLGYYFCLFQTLPPGASNGDMLSLISKAGSAILKSEHVLLCLIRLAMELHQRSLLPSDRHQASFFAGRRWDEIYDVCVP